MTVVRSTSGSLGGGAENFKGHERGIKVLGEETNRSTPLEKRPGTKPVLTSRETSTKKRNAI